MTGNRDGTMPNRGEHTPALFSSPSCPKLLAPQDAIVPSLNRRKVLWPPQAISTTGAHVGTAVKWLMSAEVSHS